MRANGSVRFVTFGCKANQYDTQVLREALLRRGWREEERGAELVVINTCTVTAEAGRKARQLARRIGRESPRARIAMIGCLAESEPELLRALPGVEWVLGNGEAKRPASFLRELGCELDPEELGVPAGITAFAGHTRAFLKIQDGCDMACAFCIIPSVRGRSRSRPPAELAAEVRRLVAAGHREIVLCGIHIGHWGRDLGSDLGLLLERLAAIEVDDPTGDGPVAWRLRLSSIEATEVEGAVLEAMVRHPERIAPHLHMPMQSGDDGVLARMNRWYRCDDYLAACARIRAELDRPAFSADILVGFPGEDERAFEATLAVTRDAGFCRIHAFPFSPRPGTAAGGAEPPPPEIVRERRARLSELASELAGRYRRSLDGARDVVLFEGGFTGLCGRYQRVRVPPESLEGVPSGLLEVELRVPGPADLDGEEAALVGVPARERVRVPAETRA
jgi:threonylcarbamoyladenosine tRNA methylthiotransferase MtaB